MVSLLQIHSMSKTCLTLKRKYVLFHKLILEHQLLVFLIANDCPWLAMRNTIVTAVDRLLAVLLIVCWT